MKKFYSTILAILFCSSALMAQEETTFAFMLGDEVIPNGGTVTISEYSDFDFMIEMQAPVYIKNVSEDASKLSLNLPQIIKMPYWLVVPSSRARIGCMQWLSTPSPSKARSSSKPIAPSIQMIAPPSLLCSTPMLKASTR